MLPALFFGRRPGNIEGRGSRSPLSPRSAKKGCDHSAGRGGRLDEGGPTTKQQQFCLHTVLQHFDSVEADVEEDRIYRDMQIHRVKRIGTFETQRPERERPDNCFVFTVSIPRARRKMRSKGEMEDGKGRRGAKAKQNFESGS